MAIEISRIEKEFIYKHMVDTKSPIEIIIGGTKVAVSLKSFKNNVFTFDIQEAPPTTTAKVAWIDVYFFFKGTRITCRAKLTDLTKQQIIAQLPEHLYRDLTRNFERIRPVEQVGVSVLLEGTRLKLNFPASTAYYEPEPPELNVKFDAARISDLLKAFREKAKSFASEQKMVMFRERQPEQITEHLVAWSGRILMLPLSDARPALKRGQENDILEEDDVRSIIKSSGKDPVSLSKQLSDHVESLYTRKIWHELYVPILFKQYVIGFIYLLRSDTSTAAFPPTVIDFVRQFARILAYSLGQNGYFQTEQVRESFDQSELVDISGSGLMFSMPLHGPSLGILNDIDIEVQIRDKTIPVKSRIMRRFQDSGRIYIGLKFLDLSDVDRDYLFTFLYGASGATPFSDEPILSTD